MINFYWKFLLGAARVFTPLKDALKGPGKSLSWSPALNSAFTRAKDLLSLVPELVHPQPDATISLFVDTSDTHLQAVLQQLLDGSWAPLVLYSKKLSDMERKYSRCQWSKISNPVSLFSSVHSCAYQKILSCSHQHRGSSALQSRTFFSSDHDWPEDLLTGGGSVDLHYSRILGLKVWFASHPHF